MKAPTACLHCRTKKRRCIIAAKGASCNLCKSLGLSCSSAFALRPSSSYIAPGPTRNANLGLVSSPGTPSPSTLAEAVNPNARLNNDLRDELVNLYFDLLHDKQHALFHRTAFVHDMQNGSIPKFLVLAVMALAARFSTNPFFDNINPWDRGQIWAAESKILFDTRSEKVSISSLQGTALLGCLSFIEGDSAMESLYGAQAIRMVQLLGLPKKLSMNSIQRETEIRVWWTTWMMDTWTSASVCIPRQLVAKPEYLKPMEEFFFDNMAVEESSRSSIRELNDDRQVLRETGLWTQMIPLTSIMGEIHELNKRWVEERVSCEEILSIVETLAFRFEYWLSSLPQQHRNTHENLQKYADRGLGRIFIALHFGYHHHSQLLYYQFLHIDSQLASTRSVWSAEIRQRFVHKYAGRCKYHAAALSDLMWKSNTTAGLECLWAINGHLLVVASSVHLHTLLFGKEDATIAKAKEMLERNFRMLLQLQTYWPSLQSSMSRLKAFHHACQDSMHGSFDMDRWMLRFLQEYALPVEETSREQFNGSSRESDARQDTRLPHQGLLDTSTANFATVMLQDLLG